MQKDYRPVSPILPMDFTPKSIHSMLRSTASDIGEEFGPDYWREMEEKQEFAVEFWEKAAGVGFQGVLVPEMFGGEGMGLQEASIIVETLAESGTGLAGPWYLVGPVYMISSAIINHGSDRQKEKYLPSLADGEKLYSLGLTEPEAGSNTFNLDTTAVKNGDEYIINGNKVWITFADQADVMLLTTKTASKNDNSSTTTGLTVFIVDLDEAGESIEINPIPKHGLNYSKSCEVFINDLHISSECILGEEGEGWDVLISMLNLERVGFAAGAVGVGKLATNAAIEYANNREVFDGPIGQYQSIQFPLAEAYAQLETAELMATKASWLYDNQKKCSFEANISKAVAVEASIDAVYNAMQTFGGWGYAKEYDVERWWREINVTRLAPVTQQMAYNNIAMEIGFPKSY